MKRAAPLALLALVAAAATARAQTYRWPVDDGDRTISAYYDHGGLVDWACGSDTYSGHHGTDIAVPKLTQVYAADGGWVKDRADGYGDGYIGSTDGGGFGNHVALFHGAGAETIYGHLSAGTGLPALGDTVACGDPIGGSGTSGNSSGPHLHFETRVGVDEAGSYYSGAADDPYAGACGGPTSFWTDQAGGRPTTACADTPPAPVDAASLVADVTIPDGTEVVAGTPFVKTWRLRNDGTTTWGAGYQLAPAGGADFGAGPVDVAAAPGAEVDVSVTMTATGAGTQRSSWQLAHDGAPFGPVVWAEVAVVASPSTDADGDGFGPGQDCDDGDADVHPGAAEACDGVDADCDGVGDEGLARTCCGDGLQACDGDGLQACDGAGWGACDQACADDGAAPMTGGCAAGGGDAGGLAAIALLALAVSRRAAIARDP